MALIKAEDFVQASLRPMLERNHLAGPRRENFIVGRILKLSIPFVTSTFTAILAPVQAITEWIALCFR